MCNQTAGRRFSARRVMRFLWLAAIAAPALSGCHTKQPQKLDGPAAERPVAADRIIRLSARNGVRALLRENQSYQPSDAAFWIEYRRLTVSLRSVGCLGEKAPRSARCTLRRQGEEVTAVTTIRGAAAGDPETVLSTTVRHDRPIIRLNVTRPSDALVLDVAGADRLTYRRDGVFVALPRVGAGKAIDNLPPCIVVQDRHSQDGLVIRTSGQPQAATMRAVWTETGVQVHVTAGAAAQSRPAGVAAEVFGFHGDATIAYEDTATQPRPQADSDRSAGQPDVQASQTAAPVIPESRDRDTGWVWFSDKGRAFRPLLADQREAQIRAGFQYGRRGDVFADLGFGGDLAVARRDYSLDEATSVTVRGLFTARLNCSTPSFDLLNTDYFGGVAVGRKIGRDSWEIYTYHESSHLGDETLDFRKRRRIDYGRESVRFLWSRDFGNLRLYGGPTYNVTGESFLRRRATLQTGAEYRFVRWGVPMYVAGDFQSRCEVDFRPSLSVQWGMELGDPTKSRLRPRIFIEGYTGYSNMGQFWNAYENSIMFGLGLSW